MASEHETQRRDGYAKLSNSLDRLQEAHFHLHQMEQAYHVADHFRWDLNGFLRALKEVPQNAKMEMQGEKGFKAFYRGISERLQRDGLLAHLSRQRDFVVHRGMLLPASSARIGVTDLRIMRMHMSIPVQPDEDSDHAMLRIACSLHSRNCDFLGLLVLDEDTIPCVEREWRLRGFDDELTDLCARAWKLVSEALREILRWLGEDPPAQDLSCRAPATEVRRKTYNRERLLAHVEQSLTVLRGHLVPG